ncbi:cobyric acid synthase CobQ [Cyanobacterium stanieri LEGE 03274]|uniref:Cobyric acid synthase n=1 Tax=Cyanobacterium stanieri LEGE 03274 TaxID=1828756 RepID=A0ABR9V721_9CHRO|nr:cobyric acid synthase CobQ [Cyanobacterium stanieri]MBE9223685.1 cobyric acid synthase CobQ [Cyanobacterium stanieri LEGE 03274]
MKAIMVVGTTSHAGKSTLIIALSRLLWRKGWLVSPFQGQNIGLDHYLTSTGGEISYAQAFQAWAAKTTPRVEMNPVLIKPQKDQLSQVFFQGHLVGTTRGKEYDEKYLEQSWEIIKESLVTLGQEFNLIICEGVGSPAEINRKHQDLANMRIATHLNADTILVADIERGGVFAHIVGTLALLEPQERALVKGIIINKFRGDKSTLEDDIKWLQEYTGIPVLGVVPWFNSDLFSANSFRFSKYDHSKTSHNLHIKIIKLPRVYNFTDFDPLEGEDHVFIEYIEPHQDIGFPDAVIIPGTKNTMADLMVLEKTGMKEKIQEYESGGGTVFGICGGYQMLGHKIIDGDNIEGVCSEIEGIDLLPIQTTLKPEKITRQREISANYPQSGFPVDGYEIHQGYTELVTPLVKKRKIKYMALFDDASLGLVNGNLSVWGCYLHGIFDNGAWRRSWLNHLRHKRGLPSLPTGISNYRQHREDLIDALANYMEKYLDLSSFY